MKYSTESGALKKYILGKRGVWKSVTSDITMENRTTEIEAKFMLTQSSISESLKLLTICRAANTPGYVTLVPAYRVGESIN